MYFQESVLSVDQRGASSMHGTTYMLAQLPTLFKTHAITSIFDAGANDCAWQIHTLAKLIKYSAGDHNPRMVEIAKASTPELDIIVHDVRTDPFPKVDALFIRDVSIHLNNANKKLMIQNWLDSSIPWILMTHLDYATENKDFEHNSTDFPFAEINWKLSPWNFPEPTDFVIDLWPGSHRHMALWHRDQICL
jgi:hypothetical protein